ncbi:WASH complex subunit homolog 1 [Cololabis saira]|uniref:WASH complex subunit homolog 1 n=1 Tax=Cololabis saira TaxID=129043 RepID=UPI002AD22409|nr:WASH complex subunit homolog 1 [Cololabis saira]
MIFSGFPFLEVFLGLLGFGLSILFCTTFCKSCSRFREEQLEREAQRRSELDSRMRSIYFIPFPRSMSHRESDDQCGSEINNEFYAPPTYSNVYHYGPPPSYTELGIKPDDLPPAYTEQNLPASPMPPPPPPPPLPPMTHSQLASIP